MTALLLRGGNRIFQDGTQCWILNPSRASTLTKWLTMWQNWDLGVQLNCQTMSKFVWYQTHITCNFFSHVIVLTKNLTPLNEADLLHWVSSGVKAHKYIKLRNELPIHLLQMQWTLFWDIGTGVIVLRSNSFRASKKGNQISTFF